MKYHNPQKKNGTITTRVVCAVCFLSFAFLWLYAFQADMMAVAQYVLSYGQTSYNRLTGALLITSVLFLLHLSVFALVRLRRRTHALTYLPSMLLLAVLTSVAPDSDGHLSSFGTWLWVTPSVLVVWAVAVWLSRQLLPFETDDKQPTGLFSRRVWVNLAQMVAMMLAVAAVGNTHAVLHYRAHAEAALMRGNAEEALRVGEHSLETDSQLTMLRVYALSLQGQLGDRLFRYPVAGTAESLLPSHTPTLMLSADSIWRHLGGRPVCPLSSERFYEALRRDSLATQATADYQLCGLLIDRQLDRFADVLSHVYTVADSLPMPRHYAEALTLYKHLRAHPTVVYSNAVLDEDWDDFQQLRQRYPLESERRLRMFDRYSGSYWYYYFYSV